MDALGITQYLSTAYHPESQGALKCFHQTLKSMLTKFCLENGKDWDQGIPFVMHAVRSARQDSLGFSPFELLFGRDVRGPLKLLLDREESITLAEYVVNMKETLVRSLAHSNLLSSQEKMKEGFDVKSVKREFQPGELVLLFLPFRKSAFQTSYQGPHKVVAKENCLNYIIETPGHRKQKRKKRKVHINLLKKYHPRDCDNADSNISSKVCCTKVEEVSNGCDFDPQVEEVRLKNSDILRCPSTKFSHLSQNQMTHIHQLLEEFAKLFPGVPLVCPLVKHDVKLIDSAAPVKQAPYRLPPHKLEIMRSEVNFLLENGLVEPSDSPWASPSLLVPKPDGSHQLCTDYHKVNALTRADSFPLPRIDDIIDSIGEAKYVTKLDLLKGYYQISLTERARQISAFVTPFGLYQYRVLPFGMRNAPATFQRLMNAVVADLENVKAYLDDLIVYSNTWQEHMSTLRSLFVRLQEAGLVINLAKSEFVHAQVVYLGHVVGGGRIAPVMAKVEAILKLPTPATRRELQRFLGMVGYYRRFCPNFSQVAAPLTSLVSPKVNFVWSDACQRAFDSLRSLLVSSPILKAPNFEEPFLLQVDASGAGVGAVLLQETSDGILHPVSYFSAKLKPHQRAYSTIEKEALSLLLALEKFQVYLDASSQKITVYSDHNPLQFVNKMKTKNQRLLRWSLALQPYNLEIRHIKGSNNIVADLLSRSLE